MNVKVISQPSRYILSLPRLVSFTPGSELVSPQVSVIQLVVEALSVIWSGGVSKAYQWYVANAKTSLRGSVDFLDGRLEVILRPQYVLDFFHLHKLATFGISPTSALPMRHSYLIGSPFSACPSSY